MDENEEQDKDEDEDGEVEGEEQKEDEDEEGEYDILLKELLYDIFWGRSWRTPETAEGVNSLQNKSLCNAVVQK